MMKALWSIASCREMDSTSDAAVGSATANVAGHGVVDVAIRRLRFLFEERGCGHQLAGLAIAALRDVEFDPGFLERMGAVRRKTFDGGNALSFAARNCRDAGSNGLAVHMHRARPALSDSATEFGAGQSQNIAQHPEKRHLGRDIDCVFLSIHDE